jgi:hypothetical protein
LIEPLSYNTQELEQIKDTVYYILDNISEATVLEKYIAINSILKLGFSYTTPYPKLHFQHGVC